MKVENFKHFVSVPRFQMAAHIIFVQSTEIAAIYSFYNDFSVKISTVGSFNPCCIFIEQEFKNCIWRTTRVTTKDSLRSSGGSRISLGKASTRRRMTAAPLASTHGGSANGIYAVADLHSKILYAPLSVQFSSFSCSFRQILVKQ